jgi:hypothetical protein
MFEGMRQLIRDDIQWSVREASGALVPGARGTHCLIFDGESIVRRVWVYPIGWDELSDDELWALLGPKLGPTMPPQPRRGTRPKNDPAIELAAETVARTKSLLAEITLLREAHRSLHRETRELISACRARRADAALRRKLRRRDAAPGPASRGSAGAHQGRGDRRTRRGAGQRRSRRRDDGARRGRVGNRGLLRRLRRPSALLDLAPGEAQYWG